MAMELTLYYRRDACATKLVETVNICWSVVPDVLYRQDACVTAMATHSHYLALGLQTGLVNVHNTLTSETISV